MNKIDLAPYLDIKAPDITKEAKEVNPHLDIFSLSATTEEGMQGWMDWILELSPP